MTKAEFYKAAETNYTMVHFNKAWELYEKLQAENEALKQRINDLEEQLREFAERECVFCRKKIAELEAQCIKYQAELMNRDPALNTPPTTEET